MTVIVGLRTNEGVWLGCDGRVTTGDRVVDGIPEKLFAFSVFDRNDQTHLLRIGVAGTGGFRQVFRRAFVPPIDETSGDPGHYAWLFVEEAKPRLRDFDGTAVIAYRDQLFHVDPDLTVLPIDSHTAIGTGGSYTLGSLATTAALDWSPLRRIEAALKAAGELSSSCGPPLQVWEPDRDRVIEVAP